jgi:hypothetical protein
VVSDAGRRARAVRWGAAAAVFVGAFLHLSSGIRVGPDGDQPPFDLDEAHKLSESYYYHLYFETGEWRHPDWHADFYARTNPPVAKYVFGAALAAAGLHVHDRALQDEFERLWRTPPALREHVPDAMLRVTRRVSAAYGAGSVALLVGVGWSVAGPLAGLLAGLLLLTVPTFAGNARLGLTDSILVFHLLLTLPATLWAARTLRRPRSTGRTVLLAVALPGVAIALAVGSKLNGALTGPLYGLGLLAAAVAEPGELGRKRLVARALLATAATALVAFGVLVLLDPTLHSGPVAELRAALVDFGDWVTKQQLDPGPPLLSFRERVAYVGFFTLRSPALLLPHLAGALGGPVMVAGFCLGLARLAARFVPARDGNVARGEHTSPGDGAIALVWIACVLFGVTAWIPVAWDRYVLPPSAAVALGVALGLAGTPASLASAWRRLALLAAATAALGIVVWRAVDPRWVDPSVMPAIDDASVQQAYLDAALAHPESVTLQQHAGTLLLSREDGAEAGERLEAALALLGPLPGAKRPAVVRRCTLGQALIEARVKAHDPVAAHEAALAYVAALEHLRADLRTTDPKVVAQLDQLVTNARQLVTKLRPPPGR